MQIFTNPNYDFVRWRWHAIALSLLVILAGLGVMWKDGVRLGVDFEGGTIFIAIRFQLGFAVGAVAATLHDLLVCLAFLAFFKYDITLNVIAGLLTITGYSVNDTIVVFDRVRENMRSMRRDNLSRIVNVAVNQTLARTVITAGTTLLSVIALYVFGGEVLEGFAFTMLVGIISGTYSTVFIAAAIAIMFQGRKPMKGQVVTAAAPETRKPGRRRAS